MTQSVFKFSWVLTLIFASSFASAQESRSSLGHIQIGKAGARQAVVALTPVLALNPGSKNLAETIAKTLQDDLAFMGYFKFLPTSAFTEDLTKSGLTPDQFKFSSWTGIGAELLIKSGLKAEGNQLHYEAYLYDVTRGRQVIAKRYVAKSTDAVTVAHTFANDIIKALTGLPGIFSTKIAMACLKGKHKNIYVMDFDGKNVKQITHHDSIAFAPAWSPSGRKLAYSLYVRNRRGVKNLNLYEFDFDTNSVALLSSRKGSNSGASYHPNGDTLALTMSFTGDPEIFALSRSKKSVTRLTQSLAYDVDPDWSPDGQHLVFSSGRRGKPMIFKMSASGGNPQRLTFAGRYNVTPTWSPQNNKIAFAGWHEVERFDIFTMNVDGTQIERLTKNQGSNEDPDFSPDGNFLVFSSNRTGRKNIYVMNTDGSFVRRLTYGLGECSSPKWSSSP